MNLLNVTRRAGLLLALPALLIGLAAGASPARAALAARPAAPAWSLQPIPALTNPIGYLDGDSCVSASF